MGTNDGLIERCYIDGVTIAVQSTVWGIGGLVGDNTGTVRDCWTHLQITLDDTNWYVGGLVGENSGTIQNCRTSSYRFPRGVSGWDNGALVGNSTGQIVSSYYFTPWPWAHNKYGTHLTSDQATLKSSYVNWDFEEVWCINDGRFYPMLQWQNIACD